MPAGLAASLPPALLRRPAAAGEWSALACLQHRIDAERWVFPVRARAFRAGQDLPAYDPDRQGTRLGADVMPEALASEFAELRAASLGMVEHTVQAERALMQPFIEGCGPWRMYFLDHVAGGD